MLRAHSGTVFAMAAPHADQSTSDAGLLVSGSWDGATAEFGRRDAGGRDRWATVQHGSPVLALATLGPSGLTAVGLFEHDIALVDSAGLHVDQLIGHRGPVTALAWSPAHSWLASGSVDADIIVWEVASGSRPGARRWRLEGHTDTVRALCWVEGRELLASGSLDGTARVWRLRALGAWGTGGVGSDPMRQAEGAAETVAVLRGHGGPVTAVVAGSSVAGEPWLATGSADRSIIVWELAAMRPIVKTPWSHGLGVCALAWLPEQRLLASASADTTVKLWRLPSGGGGGGQALHLAHELRGHTGAVHALAAVPARGWLASGSADRSVRLWRVDVSKRLHDV